MNTHGGKVDLMNKVSISLIVALAGSIVSAQPSSLPAPIPTPTVPTGSDSRGNPYLAPGEFPATVNAGKLDIITKPTGVMDGVNSDYLRFEMAPAGGPLLFTTNDLNEGDFDLNLSANTGLITDYFDDGFGNWSNPRTPWVFPTADPWDSFEPDNLRGIEGEASYSWALTIGAGTAFMYIPENGRDNNFTDFGLPTGVLHGIGQATPNDFRGGRGYNMLTGNYGNGNGRIYMSLAAAGLPSEYIMDGAIAWFPYLEGWTTGCTTDTDPAAWSERTTAPDPMTGEDVVWPSRSPVLPEDASDIITYAGNGKVQGTIDFVTNTDLEHTPDNAMLFVQSSQADSNTLTIINVIENGDAWDFLGRKDDGIDTAGTSTSEWTDIGQGDMSLIALPYNTPNLLGGSYAADGSAIKVTDATEGANLTVTRAAAGTYEVAVAGTSTEDGLLMMQPTGPAAGDSTLPGRNFMSYEYDAGNNVYVVESREVVLGNPGNIYGEEYPLVDSSFYLAYISFSNPPVGPGVGGGCNAADIAEPFGTLDLADISAFVAAFTGQTPTGDIDGNGIWDLTDISMFVAAFNGGCP